MRRHARKRDTLMAKGKFKRILRPATLQERQRHAEIRKKVMEEFPPAQAAGGRESPPGIATQIRCAREAKGLSWYAVAKLAGIPNSSTVRDIEYGRDAQLSNVDAIARALGLRLELIAESV
jgi:Helix-turn-helix domain